MVQLGRGPIYIFDASAWITCNEQAGDNRIPVLMNKLFDSGRLCNPKEVMGELERPGLISDWAKERRAKLNYPHGLPRDYAGNVGLVQHRFPGMGKAMGSKRRADPFVVALALTYHCEAQHWVIVTGESGKRPRRKIKGACDELGLPCITLAELIEVELP
jgi:hypothetical protein